MKDYQGKAAYISKITGVEVGFHTEVPRGRNRHVVPFNEQEGTYLSFPPNTDEAFIKAIAAYFSDTETPVEDNRTERLILRAVKGIADENEMQRLSKIMTGKKYFVVLLTTLDSEKWSALVSYLSVLTGEDDVLVKLSVDSALCLKFCDGTYDSSEELAKILWRGITDEHKIRLIVASGGVASGADSVISAYSRAQRAMISRKGDIRHYRDCCFTELLEKIPKDELVKYMDYITEGRAAVQVDDELKATAKTFFDCGLSLSQTAKKMYLHRNTLSARLDKLRSKTQLDIRDFRQAQMYELLSLITEIVNNQ